MSLHNTVCYKVVIIGQRKLQKKSYIGYSINKFPDIKILKYVKLLKKSINIGRKRIEGGSVNLLLSFTLKGKLYNV